MRIRTFESDIATTEDVAVNIPGVGLARGRSSSWAASVNFMSIPFALPPDGSLFLMPPVPYPEPWSADSSGQLGGHRYPPACTQFATAPSPDMQKFLRLTKLNKSRYFSLTGQRDCLYLNIFVPKRAIRQLRKGTSLHLPVIFFIYGGAFSTGDSYGFGVYDASDLAARTDAIVVTSNYRLGAEGFLAHPAMLSNGGQYNLGLLDQRLAMAWVSKHISAFGGNPARVVLIGESAGAMSICFHLTSPYSYRYYHGAILQSPGCEGNAIWQDMDRAEGFGVALAIHLGCTSATSALHDDNANSSQVLSCLRERMTGLLPNFEDWVKAVSGLGYLPDSPMPLTPVIDFADGGLSAMPNELIEQGHFHNVPLIVGTNKNEGDMFKMLNPVPGDNQQAFVDLAFHIAGPEFVEDIAAVYEPIEDTGDRIGTFLGDALFVCPTAAFGRLLSKASNRIYFYRFMHHVNIAGFFRQVADTLTKIGTDSDANAEAMLGLYLMSIGVPHTYDLYFLFNTHHNPYNDVVTFTDKESRVANYVQSYWKNFVWRLNPNSQEQDEHSLLEWPPFKVSKGQWHSTVLRILDPPTTEEVNDDIEVYTWMRCHWWQTHSQAMRVRTKPWQTPERVSEYGQRCCCDTDHTPVHCKRPHDLNWRDHCPKMDLGNGKLQTHHAPLGCVGSNPDVALRCCCVDAPDIGLICQRLTNRQLNWRDHCPEVCVEGAQFASCDEGTIKLQSKHTPYACTFNM